MVCAVDKVSEFYLLQETGENDITKEKEQQMSSLVFHITDAP